MLAAMTTAARYATLVALSLSLGCGGQSADTLVGQSAHFRLYVSPGVAQGSTPDGERALAALEANWNDMSTLLPLRAGTIDYHWVTAAELSSVCGEPAGGCEQEGPVVFAVGVPVQHELNHAYVELITGSHAPPVPLLTEGFASAIGCGDGLGVQKGTTARWQDLVALPEANPRFDAEGYAAGALLVRYLIRSRGMDAFVAYYAQAPKVRDPAEFADDFQRFWGTTLDAAWAAMNTVGPGTSLGDTPLCPCSLGPLPLGRSLADDPASPPYWTIPDAGGATIAMSPLVGGVFDDFDCLGQTFDGSGAAAAGLVRLGPGARGYVLGPLASATTGHFVSDTCEAAELFEVPAAAAALGLAVQVDRSSAAANLVYLRLQPPAGTTNLIVPFGTIAACETCAFDTPACAPDAPIAAGVPIYVQLPLTVQKDSAAQVTSTTILFQ